MSKKTYKGFEYLITDKVAEVWNPARPDEENRPFLRQTRNYVGVPFASDIEAENFVKEIIDEMLNPPVEEPAE